MNFNIIWSGSSRVTCKKIKYIELNMNSYIKHFSHRFRIQILPLQHQTLYFYSNYLLYQSQAIVKYLAPLWTKFFVTVLSRCFKFNLQFYRNFLLLILFGKIPWLHVHNIPSFRFIYFSNWITNSISNIILKIGRVPYLCLVLRKLSLVFFNTHKVDNKIIALHHVKNLWI